jgi:quercetin dioxygenase-like cupin family protein
MYKLDITQIAKLQAPQKYIIGNAWINYWIKDPLAGCSMSRVTFEAGGRTHWHHHPTVQILLVEKGIGYVQKRGEPRQLVTQGNLIVIFPQEEHWHGATPWSSFSHVAIQMEKDEGIVVQVVTDEEYYG